MKGSRPNRCPFCEEYGSVSVNSLSHHVRIDSIAKVATVYRYDGSVITDFPINFCHWCGRNLYEENPSKD